MWLEPILHRDLHGVILAVQQLFFQFKSTVYYIIDIQIPREGGGRHYEKGNAGWKMCIELPKETNLGVALFDP